MPRKRRPPPGGGSGGGAPAGGRARAFTLDDYLDHLIAESNLRDALEGRLRGGAQRPDGRGGPGGPGTPDTPDTPDTDGED